MIMTASQEDDCPEKDFIKTPAFHEIIACLKNGSNAYLYGKPGTGKSLNAKMAAKELNIPFYTVCAPRHAEQIGPRFMEAFRKGGIFCIDEVQNSSQHALDALAQLLTCHGFTFKGKESGQTVTVRRHPDFRVILCGLTVLRGDVEYYGAKPKLTEDTLSQFTLLRMEYSSEVTLQTLNTAREQFCFGNNMPTACQPRTVSVSDVRDVVSFVADVRNAIDDANLPCSISPRALRRLIQFTATGMSETSA